MMVRSSLPARLLPVGLRGLGVNYVVGTDGDIVNCDSITDMWDLQCFNPFATQVPTVTVTDPTTGAQTIVQNPTYTLPVSPSVAATIVGAGTAIGQAVGSAAGGAVSGAVAGLGSSIPWSTIAILGIGVVALAVLLPKVSHGV